jgi:hypothetical protein
MDQEIVERIAAQEGRTGSMPANRCKSSVVSAAAD